MRNLHGKDIDSLVFVIVNLLDSKECSDEAINIEIAALSAKAANTAKQMSAFYATAKYASVGIRHLPDQNRWEAHYDLTLDLYCMAAESEGILANTEMMHLYCKEVFVHGHSILDKMPVYFASALSMGKRGKFVEPIELCLDAIRQLEAVKIRQNAVIQTCGVIYNLFSTKKLLAALDADSLPIMSDLRQIRSMKLLDIVVTYSFESKNDVLLLDACIKQAQLTARHGISSSAPTALAQFGGIVSGVLNDLAVGTRIADMATSMTKKLDGQVSEALLAARTWGFTYAYSRPLHDSLKPLLHGYAEGMKFGDTEMASWCLFNHVSAQFLLGRRLRTIGDDCRIYIPHIQDMGWDEIAEATSYVWLAALYLMGRQDDEDPAFLLFQDVVGEPKFHQLPRSANRITVYAYSGDYEKGANYAIAIGDQYMKKAPGHMTCQGEAFSRGVCLYAMARKTKERKYKKHARAVRRIFQGWVKNGSVNSKHQLYLLDAEEAALGGRRKCYEAIKAYKNGLMISNRSGFLRDAGLISERYANFLLHDMDDNQQARFYAKESIRFYDEWGARRTVERLRSRWGGLLEAEIYLPRVVRVP